MALKHEFFLLSGRSIRYARYSLRAIRMLQYSLKPESDGVFCNAYLSPVGAVLS
jgi:hypothetical protein